ncbi:glycosyltransferase [Phormidium tenue]|uniref:Glycosyl transferase family 1 n=1 Tax=Phormidium tenue NIES-30 TaxID=549789 RepID=A0A1U7J6B5_9CYAN|nr:glycosyltransferase [Phormidium tenue]MBD2231985.1 glycosyltransferase [Phormidium tenue FACHB-1052]OKH48417.1 glycosyl transferase family 1 [Phormidium tenue NIES-30]
MRILSIHNAYQIRGGEDESCAAEERLLENHGHQVDRYTATNDDIPTYNPLRLAAKTIWSQTSYKAVRQTLRANSYDVVHVQNFFPLISPSVYYAAQAEGVPVVQTLRNYRLICPNALFFRDGQVCEDCVGKAIPYPGIMHGCYRQSKPASAMVTAMISTHRALKTWDRQVNLFVALTQFAKQKLVEGGLAADKIIVKPNFIDPDPGVGSGSGGFALYVGRLSVEKGLDTLINAWRQLAVPYPLKIVGDGPLEDMVKDATQTIPAIEWLGRRPMSEVHTLMGEASFLIFPSKWYETFGRVAVEAFAKGTPVVAAKIGAIAELVEAGRTGLVFEPGNAQSLAQQVQYMLNHPDQQAIMRRIARQTYLDRYTATQNYSYIKSIYKKAIFSRAI